MVEKRLAKKISLFAWGTFVLFGQLALTWKIAVLPFASARAMRASAIYFVCRRARNARVGAISLDIFKLKNIFIMI